MYSQSLDQSEEAPQLFTEELVLILMLMVMLKLHPWASGALE